MVIDHPQYRLPVNSSLGVSPPRFPVQPDQGSPGSPLPPSVTPGSGFSSTPAISTFSQKRQPHRTLRPIPTLLELLVRFPTFSLACFFLKHPSSQLTFVFLVPFNFDFGGSIQGSHDRLAWLCLSSPSCPTDSLQRTDGRSTANQHHRTATPCRAVMPHNTQHHGGLSGPRQLSRQLSWLLLLVWSPFTQAAYDLDINSTGSYRLSPLDCDNVPDYPAQTSIDHFC